MAQEHVSEAAAYDALYWLGESIRDHEHGGTVNQSNESARDQVI